MEEKESRQDGWRGQIKERKTTLKDTVLLTYETAEYTKATYSHFFIVSYFQHICELKDVNKLLVGGSC